MERLLIVKLDVHGCEAEVVYNGVPLARADAARPSAVVPVHEYTVSGSNRLELVVGPPPVLPAGSAAPPPTPGTGDGQRSASARILLPRLGSPMHESSSRKLAHLEWAPAEGALYESPLSLKDEVSLPVSFPRWRWLDAPAQPPMPALHGLALSLVQTLARDLARGEVDRFITTVRLRTEELALAYQQPAEDVALRLKSDLVELHASGAATWMVPDASLLLLRPVAGGRLVECLGPDGGPALRTARDEQGQSRSLPLRVSAVEGKLYVLR